MLTEDQSISRTKTQRHPNKPSTQDGDGATRQPSPSEQGFYTEGPGWIWFLMIAITALWLLFLIWLL